MKSSYQELMALVSRDLQRRNSDSLVELAGELRSLRRAFKVDRDLLEAVIRRVDRALFTRK